MSEHTEGKIEAYTEESFSGWFALRQITDDGLSHEVGSGDGGLEEPDARRMAAAWNVCEGIDTESLETGATLADICERSNGYKVELNAARALLREVLDTSDKFKAAFESIGSTIGPNEQMERVRSFLDACDTLEGK